ncbi:hypothetical protein pb186bvf_006593 [Paramecium bursaria]
MICQNYNCWQLISKHSNYIQISFYCQENIRQMNQFIHKIIFQQYF